MKRGQTGGFFTEEDANTYSITRPMGAHETRYVYLLCRDMQLATRTRLRDTLDSVRRGVNG
jgi:hypothetical protein